MTTAILWGASGRMGQKVAACCAENEVQILAGVDEKPTPQTFPVFSPQETERLPQADGVIDFSHPSGTKAVLHFCLQRKLPAVIACTGHSEEERSLIEKAAKEIPVLFSGNLSAGICAISSVLAQLARSFPCAEAAIVETHHKHKKDAPSGTALLLRDILSPSFPNLPIASVRGGEIVGKHEIVFFGTNETITVTHEATDRSVFARGACLGLQLLLGRKTGIYDLSDLLCRTQWN